MPDIGQFHQPRGRRSPPQCAGRRPARPSCPRPRRSPWPDTARSRHLLQKFRPAPSPATCARWPCRPRPGRDLDPPRDRRCRPPVAATERGACWRAYASTPSSASRFSRAAMISACFSAPSGPDPITGCASTMLSHPLRDGLSETRASACRRRNGPPCGPASTAGRVRAAQASIAVT